MAALPDTLPIRVALEQVAYWRASGMRIREMWTALGYQRNAAEVELIVAMADLWVEIRRERRAAETMREAA